MQRLTRILPRFIRQCRPQFNCIFFSYPVLDVHVSLHLIVYSLAAPAQGSCILSFCRLWRREEGEKRGHLALRQRAAPSALPLSPTMQLFCVSVYYWSCKHRVMSLSHSSIYISLHNMLVA